MMNYDLKTLNEEQMKPLLQTEGAVLVTAGAGSGKTRLLTHRIAYLMEEKGVNPYNLLAITFTNKATNEMKDRVCQMVVGGNDVWISTFHSMCARILRRDIDKLDGYTKDFTIYSESDSDRVIKDVLNELDVDDDKSRKMLSGHLSNWKNGILSLEEYAQNEEKSDFDIMRAGMLKYEKVLKENNALDFDDLLVKTYNLFNTCPDVLSRYANRFKYILVDEFQDTNVVQYKLLKQLASVHGNLFVVGDEDQSIYSWRGANFKNIFNFKKELKDVKVYKLERNYRSTPDILEVANKLIKNNTERLEKNLWTEKNKGVEPTIYSAYDERDEANFVANTISYLIREKGYAASDFAVLMRLNALSRSFEESLLTYNIPHKIYGGFKFFERTEIKVLIAYLRMFTNPKDDVSFQRIINFPKRGIGDGAIAKIIDIANGRKLMETILSPDLGKDAVIKNKLQLFIDTYNDLLKEYNNIKLTDFVKKVITYFDIRSAFNPKNEEDFGKLMNIDSFIASVSEYEQSNKDASLSDYLEAITLMSETDDVGQEGSVSIATIHAVKGLEFKVVFVIGVEEGIFPVARALGNNADLEEERRLMYVAVTRAEEILYITNCAKRYIYGQTRLETPSRFCRELGLIKKTKISEQKNSEHATIFSTINFFRKEEQQAKKKDTSIYKVGQKVNHPKFGEGIIVNISTDGMVGDIDFEGFGNKSLMLEIAPLDIL